MNRGTQIKCFCLCARHWVFSGSTIFVGLSYIDSLYYHPILVCHRLLYPDIYRNAHFLCFAHWCWQGWGDVHLIESLLQVSWFWQHLTQGSWPHTIMTQSDLYHICNLFHRQTHTQATAAGGVIVNESMLLILRSLPASHIFITSHCSNERVQSSFHGYHSCRAARWFQSNTRKGRFKHRAMTCNSAFVFQIQWFSRLAGGVQCAWSLRRKQAEVTDCLQDVLRAKTPMSATPHMPFVPINCSTENCCHLPLQCIALSSSRDISKWIKHTIYLNKIKNKIIHDSSCSAKFDTGAILFCSFSS